MNTLPTKMRAVLLQQYQEDVADAILSIVTGSDYVTGQLVTIDSGFTL